MKRNNNKKTYVKLYLSDRIFNYGCVPTKQAQEYLKYGHKSPLWHKIKATMATNYQNSILELVELHGAVNAMHPEMYSVEPCFYAGAA